MAEFFKVDLDVLSEMAKTLQQAGDQMDQALKAFGSEQGGKLGPSALAGAASEFQSTWKYGLGQLQQAISECTEGVGQVRQNYEQTEQGIAQSLGKVNTLLQE
jgi:uncharacterized protein YukE